jgi:ATP/maltotriose-dependent transcriptional regulator MalT
VYDERSRIFWPSGADDVARTRRDLGDDTWQQLVDEGHGLTTPQAERLAYEVIDRLTAVLDRAEAELTERELDVLRLVAEGLSNADVADRLVLSPRTVHSHLRSIFTKLGVSSRTAAVHEAARLHVV